MDNFLFKAVKLPVFLKIQAEKLSTSQQKLINLYNINKVL